MKGGLSALSQHFHFVLQVVNLSINLVVVLVITVRPFDQFLPLTVAVLREI